MNNRNLSLVDYDKTYRDKSIFNFSYFRCKNVNYIAIKNK